MADETSVLSLMGFVFFFHLNSYGVEVENEAMVGLEEGVFWEIACENCRSGFIFCSL